MPDSGYQLAARPESADDDPVVAQFMTPHIVAILSDAEPFDALRLMADQGVRHLPVFDGSQCVGLLVEIDLVRAVAVRTGIDELSPLRLGFLCRSVPTVRPDDRRSRAAERMLAGGCDAALVLDGANLRGIVTSTDLLRSLAGMPSPQTSSTP